MGRHLVDTNVVLRSAVMSCAQHATAVGATSVLLERGEELLLAPQVLVEFWSVATRPVEANGFGWTVDIVRDQIESLMEQFQVLPETPTVFDSWLRLVTEYGVIGKQVHDARLVAFMNVHEIAQILTFNTSDFRAYNHIKAVSPDELMAGR